MELQRLALEHVEGDDLALGRAPQVVWRQPVPPGGIHRFGDQEIRVPARLRVVGSLRGGYLLEGGCTRRVERCGPKVQGALHLLARDGTLTPLDDEPAPHDVFSIVTSHDGREAAWVVDTPSTSALHHLAARGALPTTLPAPATAPPGAYLRVVGFLAPGDLLVAVNVRGYRWDHFARTSGRPAPWFARSLRVAAPGLLLGEPAFTAISNTCRSRYESGTAKPVWTRCYLFDGRPADGFLLESASPDGRWLATTVREEVVLVDLTDGMPTRRFRFDHRVQDVTFEDAAHFLVVLDRVDLPGRDPWPVQWIVRCHLALECERATEDIEIRAYDSLQFAGE